ncbi:MAG: polysaccharide lyase 6 family protein [Bacteroidota bacterium]
MNQRINWLIILIIFSSGGCSEKSTTGLVRNLSELNQSIADAQPGTIITMVDGVWENVEIKFTGKGEKDNPIKLQAQSPGKVIISGQSNLSISGEYLEVSGLVFKNGFTPTSEVVSFKTSKEEVANYCRVTNCVIDNFSNPERFDGDTWVAMYGKNNRFDHNSLINKGNRGVTMAVKLPTEESRENNHIIEYNYFGPRKTLGSNGGETLRIGTSHYSRTYSNTVVENNYFDQTSGELEIISNKSCGNEFRNNVFYECQGTLTMRHGHHTLVENNYFLGNRKPNTGGVRIINEHQTVKKNYLYGLTGYRFRSALVIMNGVPNSPINRYNQVTDSYMEQNVVIDCNHIQFCAGSDEERSAVPIASTFKNNIILTQTNLTPFTVYDDVSGIEFTGNSINNDLEIPFKSGFEKVAFETSENQNGLISPPEELLDQIAFGILDIPVRKEETGASFYPKSTNNRTFYSGKTINVKPGTNTILNALSSSELGDVIQLENGGEYLMTKYAFITHPISIVVPEGEKAIVYSEKQSFLKIENGGALRVSNVVFDGKASPDQAGNNVISTSKYSMNQNYALVIENCEVKDMDKNHSFNFLKAYKHTFADSIIIRNTKMVNLTGAVITLDMEDEDLGIYNAENIHIEHSQFIGVQGAIANIYRGGTDESTFGPIVNIEDVEVMNCGNGKRNRVDGAFRFHGVQKLNVQDVRFESSKGIDLFHTNGEPITQMNDIQFINSAGIASNTKDFDSGNISIINR